MKKPNFERLADDTYHMSSRAAIEHALDDVYAVGFAHCVEMLKKAIATGELVVVAEEFWSKKQ